MLRTKKLFKDIPCSRLERMPGAKDIWIWISIGSILLPMTVEPKDPQLNEMLQAMVQLSGNVYQRLQQYAMLQSQMRMCLSYGEGNDDIYLAYPEDIHAIKKCPVLLASLLDRPQEETSIELSNPSPSVEHGTVGLIALEEKDGWKWDGAYITELPERAQTRQKQIRQMIEALAVHPDPLPTTEEPLPLIFRESPQEFQIMVQELAQDYYTFYQKQIDKPYARGLAPITSTHNIAVPSSTEMRGLMQSHTPGMQIYKQESLMSLMESDDGSESEIHLITPNNAQLRTKGDNKQEQEVLDAYIRKEKGIEGLKAMLVLISAYHDQTGGRDRKEDACVKIRDLIKRVHNNDESHADDPDEQRKFMHAFLFFARTYVTDMSKPAERSRKKQGQKLREYTPLFILEGLKADESTGIVVPKEVEYHLGKDFYDLMFGSRKQYYILPTSLILDLHSKNDQHEFCLTLYLANLINLNKGNFAIHFPEMLLQSGLETKEEIKHGHDRTRDALPAIYALEWMERVAIIKRHPHDDIDTILAIEHFRQNGTCLTETYDEYQARLIGNKMQKKLLSSETYRRVITQYYYLQGKSATELQNTRRKKLKHLLDTHDNNSIIFNAGAIIHKQAEKYRQQHLAAIELNEKAKIAAMARSKKQGKKPMQKG